MNLITSVQKMIKNVFKNNVICIIYKLYYIYSEKIII